MNYINVDPATYYAAAASINHAAGEFFTTYTFHLKALEKTAAMAGSIGPGKHWGDHYNKHVQDTDQLVTALITVADRYITALNQIGHLYALADHDPVSGTPPPAKPADPPLIFAPRSPPPPSVGGPASGLVDDGLDLARKIVIPTPNGDTHKLHAAYTVWNALAGASETTELPTELGRAATLFATVTAPEVATIDDDLRAMKTAAEDLIATFTELAGECAHQKAGHDKMRAQLGAVLSVFADALDKQVTVTRTLEIDAAVITFGVGTTAVTAVRSGKATDLVDNTVGDLRTIVDAAELHDSIALTRNITAARTGLERIHDAIGTAEDTVEAASTPRRGEIDESEKPFDPAEREIAEILANEGKDVKGVAEGATRTPDALVNGTPTEFKTLNEGASNNTVKNALNSASGQAPNAIINAKHSGISQDEAQRGLNRFLGASPDKMTTVRIIGEGWEIDWP